MSDETRKKFEEFVLPELDRLFRFALRLTSNRAAADDLVQETLLRAYRAFDNFKLQDTGVKSWLFKILHNIYFNELLAQKRRHLAGKEPSWEQIADQHPEPWPEFDVEHINWEQFDEEIKSHVEELAPEYKMVLLLWALEDLTYKEISGICNIPIGTVMSRLFRARKQLAGNLTGYARSHRLLHTNKKREDDGQ